jgi:hypothetical protein
MKKIKAAEFLNPKDFEFLLELGSSQINKSCNSEVNSIYKVPNVFSNKLPILHPNLDVTSHFEW